MERICVIDVLRRLAGLVLTALVLVLLGCQFSKLRDDRKAKLELGRLRGVIVVDNPTDAPIRLAAAHLPQAGDDSLRLYGMRTLSVDNRRRFSFPVPAGQYVVGAYADLDRNYRWDDNEHGDLTDPLQVTAGARLQGLRLSIGRQSGLPQEFAALRPLPVAGWARGEVVELSDPRFSSDMADKGIWEPHKMLVEGHPGVYMLQPYDPAKTPVLYVHGMAGYPQQFGPLIDDLDRSRFQPWVLLYPSGTRLRELARGLSEVLHGLEVDLELPRTCVVAHSMGGLVARDLANVHTRYTDHSLRSVVTIASPLAGMPSAATGVTMAPGVVPSWIDLAPDSRFLRRLFRRELPPEVEFHLLFAFDGRRSDDGVVPLSSQLRAHAQREADVLRGFELTHVGVLRSQAVAQQIRLALDRCDHAPPAIDPT